MSADGASRDARARPFARIDAAAHERGLVPHWVLCRPDKRPCKSGWQRCPASLVEVRAHLASNEKALVGLMPASLRLVVVDIDSGGDSADAAVCVRAGPPRGRASTPSGGVHLYYGCARAEAGDVQGNQKWALPEGSGDLRGAKGQVIVWAPEAVLEAICADPKASPSIDAAATLPRMDKPDAVARIATAKPGARNDTLNRETYRLARDGKLTPQVEKAAKQAAKGAGLNVVEIDRTIRSARESGTADAGQKRKGRLTPERLSVMLASLKIELRYNVRSQIAEYREAAGEWTCLSDLDEDDLYHQVSADNPGRDGAPLHIVRETWRSSLNALLNRSRVDPFLARVEGYPEWDGIPRLRMCIMAPFARVDAAPELVEWAGASIFMAIILRALKPGTKHDDVVVLVGPQGVGKSEWCASLFEPDDRDALHTDNLRLTSRSRDRIEALGGAALVELSEMAGATRAEVEDIKAFLSHTSDKVRLAYRRNPEALPRRCVFVGTSNDTAGLPNDPTGNRRFVPIRVEGTREAVQEWLCLHRAQLWAEALHRVRLGEQAHLPTALQPAQAAAAERHRRADEVIELRVQRWLEMNPDRAMRGISIDDMKGLDLDISDARHERRVAHALRLMGFERARVQHDGNRRWLWFPPGA